MSSAVKGTYTWVCQSSEGCKDPEHGHDEAINPHLHVCVQR
jgi:hypothetical protein